MSNNFEEFFNENKSEFDEHNPSDAMWQRIENKITVEKKPAVVIRMNRKWLSIAATLVVVLSAVFVYNKNSQISAVGPVAQINPAIESTSTTPNTNNTPTETQNLETVVENLPAIQTVPAELNNNQQQLASINNEEMEHYTKLVELKQQQIQILKKDEPLLYEQFSADFAKIDKEFNALKQERKDHPNNEQLLEAMIENLRLQSALLNRQLDIVKAINNNKKQRYEKTYNRSI